MKLGEKSISFILALILIVSVFTVIPVSVSAVEGKSGDYANKESIIQSGDYEYDTLSDGTISVVRVKKLSATVTVPSKIDKKTVTSIEGLNNGGTNYENVFRDNKTVRTIVLPDTIKTIGEGAFCNSSLTDVTLPDSVKTVDEAAFKNCSRLKEVTLSQGLTTIGADSFEGTCVKTLVIPDSVTSIAGATSSKKLSSFADNKLLESVTIGSGLSTIPKRAFGGCISLKTVTIPKTVKKIEEGAFGYVNAYSGSEKVSGFTIYGYSGTAAETYAVNNGFTFTALDKPELLDTPKVTKAAIVSSGINVKWNSVAKAEKYRVFRHTGSGKWVKLADTTALSLTDNKVASGTKYSYTVRCINADGTKYTSGYDNTGKSILYLSQPKVTKLENAVNGTKLIWTKVNGASAYLVFVKNGSSWKGVATVTSNTYTYTKAKSNTTYTYTVRAADSSGNTLSTYNAKGWKKTFVAAPKLRSLTNTDSGVKISFQKVTGSEKYRVFRKLGTGNWKKLTDTQKLNVIDKSAKSGKTYSYTVRCIAKDGKAFTSGFDKNGKSIQYLAQPKITKLENVYTGTKLTWSKVNGASSYLVFIKNGKSWKGIATVKTNTYTYTKVKNGTTYTYTVRAADNSKKYLSAFNAKGWNKKYYAAPRITSLTSDESGVIIKWTPVKGASAYRVFYKTSSGSWKNFKYDVKGTSMRDISVVYGRKEVYTVCAVDSKGNAVSGRHSGGWYTTYKVATPEITKLENISGGIRITWRTVPGVSTYRLYYQSSGGVWKQFADVKGSTYVDTKVQNGRVETYTVQALSKKGDPISSYKSEGSSMPYYGNSNTYVLVDIDNQHMWYVDDGEVYVHSDCVTGNYGTADTPKGTFKVNNKVSPCTLAGDGYSSNVTYWMPFIGSGWGLHDATWRSSFGGSIYKGNGSHGCVNLPYDIAEKMYAHISVGTPVIIN